MPRLHHHHIAPLITGCTILGLLIWVMLGPLTTQIEKASQQYLDNQEALLALNKREAAYRELKKRYEEGEEGIGLAQKFFLGQDEVVTFISTLEGIAVRTGNYLEIKTAASHNPSEQDQESYLVLRLSLWGAFNGLMEFIASIENNPYPPYRLIEIDTLDAQKSTQTDFDLQTEIGLKVYTQ